MTAYDNFGLLEFKQKAKKLYLEEGPSDEKDIVEIKESINNIVLWLCELEERFENENRKRN